MAFVDDLPHKLKTQIQVYIYEERYAKIRFMKGKSLSFITWLCRLLRPNLFNKDQYIYYEGDGINTLYFLINGKASFVLPSFNNVSYINIGQGDLFGIIDILGSCFEDGELNLDDWMMRKNQLFRQFTVMSKSDTETLTLTINDLTKM